MAAAAMMCAKALQYKTNNAKDGRAEENGLGQLPDMHVHCALLSRVIRHKIPPQRHDAARSSAAAAAAAQIAPPHAPVRVHLARVHMSRPALNERDGEIANSGISDTNVTKIAREATAGCVAHRSTTTSPGLTKPAVLKLELRTGIVSHGQRVTSSTAPLVHVAAAEHNARDVPVVVHVVLRVGHPRVFFHRAGGRGVEEQDVAFTHLALVHLCSASDSSAFERGGNSRPQTSLARILNRHSVRMLGGWQTPGQPAAPTRCQ
jgi:hypothetical protein